MMRMYEDHHNDTSTAVVVQGKRGLTACIYDDPGECLTTLDQQLPRHSNSGYSGDSFPSSYSLGTGKFTFQFNTQYQGSWLRTL